MANYLKNIHFDNIIVGNGAVEIIYKTIWALDIENILIATPTFSEYKRAAVIQGIPCEEIKSYSEDGTSQLGHILSKITHKTLVVICNPNNPTGTINDLKDLTLLAERLKNSKGFLLIDEAFIEFTKDYPNNSMVNHLEVHDNVIVIRAITKFFGMPGIRLGYGLCRDLSTVNKIKGKMEPWNINTMAVIAGLTVLQDEEYIVQSRKWMEKESKYLHENLGNLEGTTLIPSAANFILLKIKGCSPWDLKDALLKKGILIRTPQGFKDLSQEYFRIAIKDRVSNDKLLKALGEILSDGRGGLKGFK